MRYLAFIIALIIVLGFGLWARQQQRKTDKRKTKKSDPLEKHRRRANLKRIK